MKLETDYARQQHLFYSIPVRDAPPANLPKEEVVARRRTVRASLEALVQDGVLGGDPVALALLLGDAMLVMGGTLAQLGLPGDDVKSLLLAAQAQLEAAATALDRALLVQDLDAVAVQVRVVQLTCGGLCYVLGFPYREVLDRLHAAYTSGGAPTRGAVAEVLRAQGLDVTDEPPAPEPPATPPAPRSTVLHLPTRRG